jgi:hypothetical protein
MSNSPSLSVDQIQNALLHSGFSFFKANVHPKIGTRDGSIVMSSLAKSCVRENTKESLSAFQEILDIKDGVVLYCHELSIMSLAKNLPKTEFIEVYFQQAKKHNVLINRNEILRAGVLHESQELINWYVNHYDESEVIKDIDKNIYGMFTCIRGLEMLENSLPYKDKIEWVKQDDIDYSDAINENAFRQALSVNSDRWIKRIFDYRGCDLTKVFYQSEDNSVNDLYLKNREHWKSQVENDFLLWQNNSIKSTKIAKKKSV